MVILIIMIEMTIALVIGTETTGMIEGVAMIMAADSIEVLL